MTLFVCGRFYFGTYVFSAKLLGGSPSKHRSFFAVCKHVCPFSSAVWLILSTTWIFSFAFLSPWLSAHLYLFVIMNRIQNTGSINNQIKKITCINADCFWKVYKLKSKINKNRPCFWSYHPWNNFILIHKPTTLPKLRAPLLGRKSWSIVNYRVHFAKMKTLVWLINSGLMQQEMANNWE